MRVSILFSLLFSLFFSLNASAQKNAVGLSLGISGSDYLYFAIMDGAGSYELNTGFQLGVHYERQLNRHIDITSGLHWYHNAGLFVYDPYPGLIAEPKEVIMNVFYLPLHVKFNLHKYFFINTGISGNISILNQEYTRPNSSGLGAGIGIGTDIPLSSSLAIQINPYIDVHRWYKFERGWGDRKLLDAGLKLRILWRK